MKFKDVRDRERGYKRRIEELEDALRFCLLACETADGDAIHWSDSVYSDAVFVISDKCEQTLSEGLDKQ